MIEEPTTEKIDWLEAAIEYESTPDRLRDPKLQQDFIKNLGVPRSTYFRTLSLPENQERIIKIAFKQAKKRTPNVLDKMGQKAEDGNDKSQEMFMEYILEIKKKLELSGEVKVVKQIYDGKSLPGYSSDKENISTEKTN